jgi:DNA polymerase
MTQLWLDTETYCETDIKRGHHRYAEDVEVMLITWALDDEPPQLVDLTQGDAIPAALLEALADPLVEVVMHNSAFDRAVLRHALGVDIPVERVHDTMVRAQLHSLPGSLDKLCAVLRVDANAAKHKAGAGLIQLFCKPRPKNVKLRRATWRTHPEKWEEFCSYALADITAMREVYRKLPRWNWRPEEIELWHLDQEINERGFRVDLGLVDAAIEAVADRKQELSRQTREQTDGAVASTNQRDALLLHLADHYGFTLPNMTGPTLEKALALDLPAGVRELLAIRLEAATASVAKYQAVARSVSSDGRLRGTLAFCGASRTGRWAGRIFQPQNLPSRSEFSAAEIAVGIDALKMGALDLIGLPVMPLCSAAVRGVILPSEGRHLVVADLSNIEGRVAAWIAGEDWKVEAFTAYDRGEGPDLYKVAYARAFGVDPRDVSKADRQIGKVMELALGYGGGVGAFVTFALSLNVDLDAMADQAWSSIPDETRREAAEFLDWTKRQKRATFGLANETFIVCEAFKRLWRASHPNVVQLWADLENAMRASVAGNGFTRSLAGDRLNVLRLGPWARLVRPSGSSLSYPSLKIDEKNRLTYVGQHQYTRQWQGITTYGGKLFENVCQAIARDVLAHGMVRASEGGFDILLTVHDEVIAEAGRELTSKELSSYMVAQPRWAAGLPLAAAGFEAERYRKD